jgi:hypothetical protein
MTRHKAAWRTGGFKYRVEFVGLFAHVQQPANRTGYS